MKPGRLRGQRIGPACLSSRSYAAPDGNKRHKMQSVGHTRNRLSFPVGRTRIREVAPDTSSDIFSDLENEVNQ
jgi:hypothetical protein